jgi:RNA polymerase sigma-70 factor (ECF subfamily)
MKARQLAEESPAAPREVDRLLDQLRDGRDREANQRRLFRRYYRLVRHFFLRRGCSPEEAEDLSQETFLRLFRALDDFRGDARFESWLLRIAGNVHCEMLRKASAGKRSALETPLDPSAESGNGVGEPGAAASVAEPLRRLLGKERVRVLASALDRLPPQMGQCFLLRFGQELSYREIAEVLQTSIDVVKVQLHRGRRQLRQLLAEHFDDPSWNDLTGGGR